MVVGASPADVCGERFEEKKEERLEREAAVRERVRKLHSVLGFLVYFYKLLGQLWKFCDIRSIPKIRVNHLKLPDKFLSFV